MQKTVINKPKETKDNFFAQASIAKFEPHLGIYLTPDAKKGKVSLLMPPPNITGQLHLGHALNNFIQDAIVRWSRLQQKETLWIPGFDHAGIATEVLVNKWLKANRLAPKDRAQKNQYFATWAQQKQTAIRQQWTDLHLLVDTATERFTYDAQAQQFVTKAFVQLFDQGLIYQEKKLVNWDCTLQTAISNIEVEHQETNGTIYFFKYPLVDNPKKAITIATTRPETMFGDVALFVHPDDERYKKWIGHMVINPVNQQEIPLLSDPVINPDFGTGAVKCTPAHDFADFQLGVRHQLKFVTIMNRDGTLNNLCGQFQGLDRLHSRELILKMLAESGAFTKEEQRPHALPISSRSGAVIEPLLSDQWFLKTKQWAKSLQNQKTQINFLPKKYEKHLWNWLEKIEDWCISRQLSWGHRLPIYTNTETGKVVASLTDLGPGWTRSTDVLDTWFSSGLWTLINFNWTKNSVTHPFFPISYLVTSYDIIFFWVARMLFLHSHFAGQIPFQQILIHGLVRTADNQKMSKSKGNAVDPDNLIKEYGCDALRFYLLSNYKIGEDLTFSEEKLVQSAQFINKLINVDQFIEQNIPRKTKMQVPEAINEPINRWVLEQFEQLRKNVHRNYDQKLFALSLQKVIQFAWKDFSNFYLRVAWSFFERDIAVQETQAVLNLVWTNLLTLLHPFMPQVTYYLWTNRSDQKMALNHFPPVVLKPKFSAMLNVFFKILAAKEENPQKFVGRTELIYQSPSANRISDDQKTTLNAMLFPFSCVVTSLVENYEQQIIIQKNETEETLTIEDIEHELARANRMLANEDFVRKAKPEIVEQERAKKRKYEQLLKDKISQ